MPQEEGRNGTAMDTSATHARTVDEMGFTLIAMVIAAGCKAKVCPQKWRIAYFNIPSAGIGGAVKAHR